MSTSTQSGLALILVLLVTSFLSAVGLGLALVLFMDQLASGNHRGSVAMLYAADAGIELAARDLARLDNWNAALDGSTRGRFTDGAPTGVRAIPGGGAVSLTGETNLLNCGKRTPCTPLQMDANSRERPWGANNPRWRLYAYGPFQELVNAARPVQCYLAVWVADDSREEDDNPAADAEVDEPGRGVVRVRAEVFGPRGARRAIEAELARVCRRQDEGEDCLPGIRVQSWQELRQLLP
jgi:hypothetical protein